MVELLQANRGFPIKGFVFVLIRELHLNSIGLDKELVHKQKTPIIAFSASAFKEDVEKAQEVGCDYHLAKPTKKSSLLSTNLRFSDFKG